jgi:hypothetical protein
VTRAETIEAKLTDLRKQLERADLSAMESDNLVRAIVHWEQELAQLD